MCHILVESNTKTLFVKNKLNTFSDRGYLYGHNEKKLFKYFKNELNGEENKSIYQKKNCFEICAFKFLGYVSIATTI